MVLFITKKRSRLILAAFLVFAIMGAFTFAEVEPLYAVNFQEDMPISDSFLLPVDYTIDCLAEGDTMMSQTGRHSFSPLRIFIVSGLQHTGALLSQSSLEKSEKANYFNIKNTIPLKLRT